jgi:hypothetical protein
LIDITGEVRNDKAASIIAGCFTLNTRRLLPDGNARTHNNRIVLILYRTRENGARGLLALHRMGKDYGKTKPGKYLREHLEKTRWQIS